MARTMKSLLLLSLLVGSWRAVAEQAHWVPPPPPADASEEIQSTVKQADQLYDTREQAGHMDQLLSLLRTSAAKNPGSYDVHWRLSRALFWVGDDLKPGDRLKAVSEEGAAAGDKAVAARPNGAEGLYFGALNLGSLSHAVGILNALMRGLEGKFRDPLLATEKLNPGIDNGGLYNALGRYKFELPWPKQDLDASVVYLRKALQIYPPDLRARVYLAETLAARNGKGDLDEAKRLLKEVTDAQVGRYDTAEELRDKELARALAAKQKWTL